jgi:probable HAF family extracellular repeat protein
MLSNERRIGFVVRLCLLLFTVAGVWLLSRLLVKQQDPFWPSNSRLSVQSARTAVYSAENLYREFDQPDHALGSVLHDGWINDNGEAAGTVVEAGGTAPFVWRNASATILSGLGNEQNGAAVAINSLGEAAGWSYAPDGPAHATYWDAEGHVHDLGIPRGYANSMARGISDDGLVVGYAYNEAPKGVKFDPSIPFCAKGNRFVQLADPPGYLGGRAFGVNNRSQIAGWVVSRGEKMRAVLWNRGVPEVLPLFPGGTESTARSVNDSGDVVGSADHGNGRVTAALWSHGQIVDLGSLYGDKQAKGYAINDAGQVVGVSAPFDYNDPRSHAFEWDKEHGMRDLALTLAIDPMSRPHMNKNMMALSVNGRGQVLMLSFFDRPIHRFLGLMTPLTSTPPGVLAWSPDRPLMWPRQPLLVVGAGQKRNYKPIVEISCGGLKSGGFDADRYVDGGTAFSMSQTMNAQTTQAPLTLDTSGIEHPAPQAVYQHCRWGDFTYDIPVGAPGRPCVARLHFAEMTWTDPGQRVFGVSINGKPVLKDFDIVEAAGASMRAVVEEFAVKADARGHVVIHFTKGRADNPVCNGIEIDG